MTVGEKEGHPEEQEQNVCIQPSDDRSPALLLMAEYGKEELWRLLT